MEEEVIAVIRKLSQLEQDIHAIELACTGRDKSMAAEAKGLMRQAQVYLDTIVRAGRRNERRGNVPPRG